MRWSLGARWSRLPSSPGARISTACMHLPDITPMIITFNEEANIGRVLEALAWAQQILVIDSGSTDGTLTICTADSRVTVAYRAFDSFAAQCNFGLTQVHTPWVLSLDADYVPEAGLAQELRAIEDDGFSGFR